MTIKNMKKLKLKTHHQLLLMLCSCLFLLNYYVLLKSYTSDKMNRQSYLYKNHHWMINNNVMQYSCYLIVPSDTTCEYLYIESILAISTQTSVNSFKCLISTYEGVVVSIKKPHNWRVLNKVGAQESYHLTFKFKRRHLLSFKTTNIGVAIILKSDYNFTPEYCPNAYVFSSRMIHYQKADVLRTLEQSSKIKGVAHCLQVLYHMDTQQQQLLKTWLNIHHLFGIKKIVMYDAGNSLTLADDYPSVEVRSYDLDMDGMCRSNFAQDSLEHELVRSNCVQRFHETAFKNPFAKSTHRWFHQAITNNACYLTLRLTYEFVSLYDFDEIILPRGEAHRWNLYSYLNSLITVNRRNLTSIEFANAFYFEPSYSIREFLRKLAAPTTAEIHLPFYKDTGHTFLIDNLTHVSALQREMNKLPEDRGIFSRSVYLVTAVKRHHYPKSVHYTANVHYIYTHFALFLNKSQREHVVHVPIEHGFVSHFRRDYFTKLRNFTSSITNFNIDMEYVEFLRENKKLLVL